VSPETPAVARLVCPHRPPCPGCPRLGAPGVDRQKRLALERLAAQMGALLAPPVEGARTGFRHRARLAVRGRSSVPKIGIFQEGSHRIADTPSCLVHHPLINLVARALKESIKRTRAEPYFDGPHKGLVRYVQVVVERPSATAQVVVVTRSETPDSAMPLLEELRVQTKGLLHSLWWNGQPLRDNAILGPHWRRIFGPETVRETIAGVPVHYPPGAFGQSNLEVADRLVELVHSYVPAGSRVAEFHAGVGAIGLGLLERSAAYAFNEIARAGLEGLERGLAEQPPANRDKAVVRAGSAAGAVDLLGGADVVIVDPPRKGLEPPLLERLTREPPATLVAISCGFEAFQREAAALTARGTLRLDQIAPFDLFPHTDQVEVVARFAKT
jgi:23S rRNA (uracil1939-C5)-methyltransferase